ncbi:hypothetical protein [Mesorhizobium sp.]|uniref:hypothetical protein n=1 Tax=Mesorhizobium sp. TaxID=1871066 RepID=UPI00121F5F1F|nr:hypothetical protein [Mesorhizobium sp.]TIN80003.1 MAG: hypothetical protein E5Y09_06325 [Mesorhizobium sp.]
MIEPLSHSSSWPLAAVVVGASDKSAEEIEIVVTRNERAALRSYCSKSGADDPAFGFSRMISRFSDTLPTV